MQSGFFSKTPVFIHKSIREGTGAGKRFMYATGNPFYPKTRYSAGIYILDKAVERFKMKWIDEEQFMIAEGPTITFMKPKIWLPEVTGRLVKEGLEKLAIKDLESLTVLTPNRDRAVGQLQEGTGETDLNIPIVNELVKDLKSDKFYWLSVGVAQPDTSVPYIMQDNPTIANYGTAEHFEDLFMDCRIPTKHLKIFDEAATGLVESWYSKYAR